MSPDQQAPAPNGLRQTFRSLRHRNYRLFFIGQGISLIGTWMQQIAMTWLVYRMTGSAFLLGVVGFSSQIPAFFIAPVAGVYADRLNKHRIVVTTQTLAMLQAFTLAGLTLFHLIQVWHIIALSLFMGIVNGFDMPTRQAFVIEMVGRREDLPNAIALNSSLFNSARLIGPSIAGIVVSVVGEGLCFFLNGVSFIAVIIALLSMRLPPHAGTQVDANVILRLKEGFRYVLGSLPIRSILMLLGLVNLLSVHLVLMPVVASDILHGGALELGLLMGSIGCGAVIGALYLASRGSVRGLPRIIARASGLFGLSLVAFSFSRDLALSMSLMVLSGLGMMIQMASSNTIVQTIVDDDKRGRVMSLYSMAFLGMAPIGNLLGGSLATTIGTPATVLVSGIVCLGGTVLFTLNLPAFRREVRPTYVRLGIISRE